MLANLTLHKNLILSVMFSLLVLITLGMTCQEYADLPSARDYQGIGSPMFDQSGTFAGGVIPWYIEYRGDVEYRTFWMGKFELDPVNNLEDGGFVQMDDIRMRLGILWEDLLILTLQGVDYSTNVSVDLYTGEQGTEDWQKTKDDLTGASYWNGSVDPGEEGPACTEGEFGGPFWPPTDWYVICGTVNWPYHLYLPFADLQLYFSPANYNEAHCDITFSNPAGLCNYDNWRHRIP